MTRSGWSVYSNYPKTDPTTQLHVCNPVLNEYAWRFDRVLKDKHDAGEHSLERVKQNIHVSQHFYNGHGNVDHSHVDREILELLCRLVWLVVR